MRRLDVALAELGREALQQPGLLFGELDLALRRCLLEPQQPFVLGEQAVALPHPAYASGRHLNALEPELLLNPGRAVAGIRERMVEDRLLDLGRDPVRMWSLGAGQPIDQPLGPVSLEIAADLVELLATIAHHLAGTADVGEVLSELQQ